MFLHGIKVLLWSTTTSATTCSLIPESISFNFFIPKISISFNPIWLVLFEALFLLFSVSNIFLIVPYSLPTSQIFSNCSFFSSTISNIFFEWLLYFRYFSNIFWLIVGWCWFNVGLILVWQRFSVGLQLQFIVTRIWLNVPSLVVRSVFIAWRRGRHHHL